MIIAEVTKEQRDNLLNFLENNSIKYKEEVMYNINGMDRTDAIVQYKNEFFVDSNHQYALCQAFGLDDTDEAMVDSLIGTVDNKRLTGDISTYDVFDNTYMVIHDDNTFKCSPREIIDYASKAGLILCQFIDKDHFVSL